MQISERPIRVVIADDHALIRDGLKSFLSSRGGFEVVGEADNGDTTWEVVANQTPDVLVLDVDMPGREVFGLCRQLAKELPGTAVLFLSAYGRDRYIEAAREAGAAGFMTKSEPADRVAAALRTVAKGDTVFGYDVQERLVSARGGGHGTARTTTRIGTLTPREMETLRYIARGLSKKAIAEIAGISVKTVDNHCTSLMNKLDIHDRVELARFAIREGISEP
ncbi:MAG: response regulator transcription factor [Planctomycetota bacterium]